MASCTENSPAERIVNQNPESAQNKTLIVAVRSSDGQEFLVLERAAVLSITIKQMMEEDWDGKVIPLANVDGKTLSRIIKYLNIHADESVSDEEKKKFDEKFISEKPINVLFDYVLAANYLNITDLMDIVCKKIADTIQNKSVNWVRKTFYIVNDFDPEKEEEMMSKDAWVFEGVDDDD